MQTCRDVARVFALPLTLALAGLGVCAVLLGRLTWRELGAMLRHDLPCCG